MAILHKKILFAYSGKSFLINAIVTNLKNAGFEVVCVEATTKNLEDHKEDGREMILFLSNYVFLHGDFLEFVKDYCYENEKTLFLIGDKQELQAVREYFPDSPAFLRYERPFEIKDLTRRIEKIASKSRMSTGRKSILIVDDDSDFLKLVRGWLSKRYQVHTVDSGRRALAYLETDIPDLILLDFEMPELSGPEVLGRIRSGSTTEHIPVIFLTGKDDRASVMKAIEKKPDRYVLKTADRDTLLAVVDWFFAGQK